MFFKIFSSNFGSIEFFTRLILLKNGYIFLSNVFCVFVIIFENNVFLFQMDPNLKILTFRCAIRGRPLPEVIFQGVSSQPFDVTEDLPDEVVNIGPNEAVATRVVTVDAYGLAQATQRIRDGQDTSPRCVIRPSYDGQVNSHDFYQTN